MASPPTMASGSSFCSGLGPDKPLPASTDAADTADTADTDSKEDEDCPSGTEGSDFASGSVVVNLIVCRKSGLNYVTPLEKQCLHY